MKKLLKWLGILLVVLIAIGLVAATGVFAISGSRLNKSYDVAVQPITIPTDAAGIAEGGRLITIRGCNGCHTPDLGGTVMIDDPALGTFSSANLTSGAGSATAQYTVEDWDRAIRHGVKPNGKGVMIMPSNEFSALSDEQLGQMIAYLQTVPPVDREHPKPKVGPLGRVLFMAGQLPLLSADGIDQTATHPASVPPSASVEYGAYMATTCQGCHYPNMAGGPSLEPGGTPAANLTPSGALANWTLDDFKTVLRTGVTPDGVEINPEAMPWPAFQHMNDVEIEAVWLYLNSLPPAMPAK